MTYNILILKIVYSEILHYMSYFSLSDPGKADGDNILEYLGVEQPSPQENIQNLSESLMIFEDKLEDSHHSSNSHESSHAPKTLCEFGRSDSEFSTENLNELLENISFSEDFTPDSSLSHVTSETPTESKEGKEEDIFDDTWDWSAISAMESVKKNFSPQSIKEEICLKKLEPKENKRGEQKQAKPKKEQLNGNSNIEILETKRVLRSNRKPTKQLYL